MTTEQVKSIIDAGRFPGRTAPAELVETHISWVVLSPDFAFKIKKPVRFPFLDFSKEGMRRFFCEKEVRLNRRLAPSMYLGTLPISTAPGGELTIGGGVEQGAAVVDHAVWMRRMDESRQMDRLLRLGAVSADDMGRLAGRLADFHRTAIIEEGEIDYQPEANRADFDDLFSLEKECATAFGPGAAAELAKWREQAHRFLHAHGRRLRDRAEGGFWVDGHGDLHARNIFLTEDEGPVVFDCIEFSDHLRRLDVLADLAFLCMDLDAAGHPELERAFLRAYLAEWRVMEDREDERIFLYFKAYRANVRLKVALIEHAQHPSERLEDAARTYWRLVGRHLAEAQPG